MPITADVFAGSLAGVFGTIVGYPLDTIKSRLQTQGIYSSGSDCFRKIIKTEGFHGLFRGMMAPIVSLTVLNSICFGVYGHFKRYFDASNIKRGLILPNNQITNTQIALSGGISGALQSIISGPFELVKVQLQLDNLRGKKYTGTFDFLHTYPRDSLRSLFRGFGINSLRETSFGVFLLAFL
eukprot:TRINITY_DN1734_c0_g1_i2.p1 TRINITY_DN1734_c0_g1~~TRINITY_DN1734_c0_g1_i2.p1  ORF type:complete len:182 (+),score=3.24 TRINITY_DN1734_c0_g1_i2:97-642(+)